MRLRPEATEQATVPLCVDLDGTLIRTDLTWESLVPLLRRNPFYLPLVFFWLLRGRAYLKQQVAQRSDIDPASLPYNELFLEFVRKEKSTGRDVLLVTASDRRLADRIQGHLNLFTEVLGSDGKTNLRGKDKSAKLIEKFGSKGFDYAGNSSVDLPVWRSARQAIVVNGSTRLEKRARQTADLGRVFQARPSIFAALLQAFRPHQWVKNLILFVPLITSHRIAELPLAMNAVLAFVAFCLCASGVYLLNDLFDLDSDRHHPTKKSRPLSSGALPLPAGIAAVPVLLGAAALLASMLSRSFAGVLGLYVVLTSAYSWKLKQVPLLDVFCLAALYTLRLIAGHEATGVKYSFWLLAFSMFIFLSLALVKRYVELAVAPQVNRVQIRGRGYGPEDVDFVSTLGCSSGYLAVLVLALYVNSQEVTVLYRNPTLLLLICPLLLFWISRVWLLAHRRCMDQDPVVFAITDSISYLIGLFTVLVIWWAS